MRHAEAALAQWVVQEGRGLVVVVNKMDLLAGSEKARLRSLVMKAVPEEIKKLLPQVFSAFDHWYLISVFGLI
jgi:predicted GTPase